MSEGPSFPPIADLVPHREPMLALDALVEWEPGRAVATTTLSRDHLLVAEGRASSAILVELMAQTVAACLGLEAVRGGAAPRPGMLVACRRVTFGREWVEAGEHLRIEVERRGASPDASRFDGLVFDAAGVELARASMTLVHAGRR